MVSGTEGFIQQKINVSIYFKRPPNSVLSDFPNIALWQPLRKEHCNEKSRRFVSVKMKSLDFSKVFLPILF